MPRDVSAIFPLLDALLLHSSPLKDTAHPASALSSVSKAFAWPGMTKMIVVQAMGIALLSRGRHGPSMLTDAGQVVLSYCESLLAVANEAWRTLSDFRTANAGVVSIGASQTVATYLLPQLIAGFRMHNPQVCWPG